MRRVRLRAEERVVKNMSDPAKNAEVEDVLSSIRRLVSEDKRPLQTPQAEAKPDRLVLTPALRVEDTAVPEMVQEVLSDVVDDEVQAALAAEEESAHSTAETSQEDASTAETAPFEEDYSEDPYGFNDDKDLDGEGPQSDVEEPEQADHQPEEADHQPATEDHQPAMEEVERDEAVDTLSAKIAALETAIGDIADDWEPDGAAGDVNAAEDAPAMAWEDVAETDATAEAQADDADDMSAQSGMETGEASADDAIVLEAEEVFEADDAEEQSSGGEADTADHLHTAQDDPAEGSVSEADIAAGAAAAAGLDMTADDQLLDEDTLREMITEIVHAELQGALGERITRNVRRLVRREIHRALTARDLD